MSVKAATYNEINTERKAVALTFDDGPHPVNTPELLLVLRQYDVKATFYVMGSEVDRFPAILQELVNQGHEIGNHTYTHPHLPEITSDRQREELALSEQAIEKAIGRKPLTFRPPYLDFDDSVLEISAGFGYPVINGYGCDDWAMPGTDRIVHTILGNVGTGVIIVCHDGGGDRSQTVEACAVIIPELLAQGYEFVTVSELLALQVYSAV
jgi:peptidoglycan/xylan/chitin deacetylase (PgdA/CDA1 family)